MKRKYIVLASTALLAGLVIGGSAFCLNNSPSANANHWANQRQVVSRSVIKVHTDRGVITLPGRADSWTEVEDAEFVADSLAEVQIVNNQVSMWPISKE
jgi:hypothetical protein